VLDQLGVFFLKDLFNGLKGHKRLRWETLIPGLLELYDYCNDKLED
jgi:hypothetical protein